MSDYAKEVIDICYEWTRLLLISNAGLNATIYMCRTYNVSKLFGRRRDASNALKKSHHDFVDDATVYALKSALRVAKITVCHGNETVDQQYEQDVVDDSSHGGATSTAADV